MIYLTSSVITIRFLFSLYLVTIENLCLVTLRAAGILCRTVGSSVLKLFSPPHFTRFFFLVRNGQTLSRLKKDLRKGRMSPSCMVCVCVGGFKSMAME